MAKYVVEPKLFTGVNGDDPGGVADVESFRGRFAQDITAEGLAGALDQRLQGLPNQGRWSEYL